MIARYKIVGDHAHVAFEVPDGEGSKTVGMVTLTMEEFIDARLNFFKGTGVWSEEKAGYIDDFTN